MSDDGNRVLLTVVFCTLTPRQCSEHAGQIAPMQVAVSLMATSPTACAAALTLRHTSSCVALHAFEQLVRHSGQEWNCSADVAITDRPLTHSSTHSTWQSHAALQNGWPSTGAAPKMHAKSIAVWLPSVAIRGFPTHGSHPLWQLVEQLPPTSPPERWPGCVAHVRRHGSRQLGAACHMPSAITAEPLPA